MVPMALLHMTLIHTQTTLAGRIAGVGVQNFHAAVFGGLEWRLVQVVFRELDSLIRVQKLMR